jgi:hypothetical protein
LKGNGLIKAVGVGIDLPGFIPRFLERVDPDFFLVAMPDTLRRQAGLDNEFPACVERGIGFVIGTPSQSGILATGAIPPPSTKRPMYADFVATTGNRCASLRRLERTSPASAGKGEDVTLGRRRSHVQEAEPCDRLDGSLVGCRGGRTRGCPGWGYIRQAHRVQQQLCRQFVATGHAQELG